MNKIKLPIPCNEKMWDRLNKVLTKLERKNTRFIKMKREHEETSNKIAEILEKVKENDRYDLHFLLTDTMFELSCISLEAAYTQGYKDAMSKRS